MRDPRIDFNAKDNSRSTALTWAVRERRTDIVALLLSSLAPQEPLAPDPKSRSSTRTFLDADALALNDADDDDSTLLMWAVLLGETEIVEALLRRVDLDVNRQCGEYTVLHYACLRGPAQILEMLLKREDLNLETAEGNPIPLAELFLLFLAMGFEYEASRLLETREARGLQQDM
ncbi:hypothetical protein BJX64DRAFT_292937 [Aspergillus heterothallicus]